MRGAVIRIIGPADDFYRVRVMRVDLAGDPDLEWRDDVLYRDLPISVEEQGTVWRVEAVRLADDEPTVLAEFDSADEAHGLLERLEEDLRDLTKAAFEARWIIPATQGDLSAEDDGSVD